MSNIGWILCHSGAWVRGGAMEGPYLLSPESNPFPEAVNTQWPK